VKTLNLIKLHYYIDTSVLLENIALVRFIRNYIWDLSGIFSISSLVKLSMTSLISCLTLKLQLNLLVYMYDQVFLESLQRSLVIFRNLWQSLEMFGKYSETLMCGLQTIFEESLEISWKVVGNLRKLIKNVIISISI